MVAVARPKSTRSKKCRVCSHPKCDAIVRVLAAGVAPRAIARRFGGVARRDIIHHATVCVPRDWKKKEGIDAEE